MSLPIRLSLELAAGERRLVSPTLGHHNHAHSNKHLFRRCSARRRRFDGVHHPRFPTASSTRLVSLELEQHATARRGVESEASGGAVAEDIGRFREDVVTRDRPLAGGQIGRGFGGVKGLRRGEQRATARQSRPSDSSKRPDRPEPFDFVAVELQIWKRVQRYFYIRAGVPEEGCLLCQFDSHPIHERHNLPRKLLNLQYSHIRSATKPFGPDNRTCRETLIGIFPQLALGSKSQIRSQSTQF